MKSVKPPKHKSIKGVKTLKIPKVPKGIKTLKSPKIPKGI